MSILNRSATNAAVARRIDGTVHDAAVAKWTVTASNSPTNEAKTPRSALRKTTECCIWSKYGTVIDTIRNEGKKIATVPRMAPGGPAI